jgi:hypothetical protein
LRAEDEGRKGELVSGVLFLKSREAVAEAAETVGGKAAVGVLSEGGRHSPDAVSPWFRPGG